MTKKRNKTLNERHKTINEKENVLLTLSKTRGIKHTCACTVTPTHTLTHTLCSKIFCNFKFTQCDSIKLGCRAQNFIFKDLGAKQQPYTCPLMP